MPLQQLVGEPKGLVPPAQVEQALHHRHRQPVGHLADAPLPAELQPGPHRPHAGGRALQLEQLGAEVAVGERGPPAKAEPQAEVDRLPHVVEAAEVAELVAGAAAVLQGPLPDVVGPHLPGQVHRPLQPVERLGGPPGGPDLLAHLQVGVGQPGPRRLPLQQRDGGDDQPAGLGGLAPVPAHPGLAGHRLPGAEVVASGLEAGDGLGQQLLGLDGPAGLLGGLRGLLQDRGPLAMVAVQQRQGPLVVDVGPGDVQGHGPVAGQDQEAAGGAVQGRGLVAGPRRPGQLQRRQVVVGEQLGMVGDPVAGDLLDPGGDRPVLGDPGRPRELAVGHLAGEVVPEGVLALAGDRGAAGGADERPAGQLLEVGLGAGRVPPADREQRPRPEHRADHRGVLQQRSALGGEGVQPGGDQGVDRVGKDRVGGREPHRGPVALQQAPVVEHAADLLGVERVAADAPQQGGVGLVLVDGPPEQGGEQAGGVVVRQRGQDDRGRPVRWAPSPVRAPVGQLGPGRGHDQQGDAARLPDQVPDEGEQGVVGPVQVLEHDHQRPPGRHRLQEAAPGGEDLVLLRGARPGGHVAGQAEQRRQPRLQPLALGRLLDRGGDDVGQLGRDRRRAVELEDAGLGLEHLPERPEADALPVGQAVALAPGDQLGLGVHERAELPDQPALAHPGLAGDGDQPHRGLVPGAGVGAPQPVQLALPAQERRGRRLVDGDPGPAAGGGGQPHRQRSGLALDPDRGQRLVVEQPPGRPEGRLADQHAPDRRNPLQPGGGVDHVADHDLAVVPVGGHHRLPGVDADADVEGQLLHGLQDGQAAAHRPLGVVLVGRGRPEHGHHPVADELVQGPPEPLDLPPQAGMVGPQQRPHVLGVGPVRPRREPGQVAEQHRDHPPLLQPGPGGDRGPAPTTERKPSRDVGTTGGAGRHGPKCTVRSRSRVTCGTPARCPAALRAGAAAPILVARGGCSECLGCGVERRA